MLNYETYVVAAASLYFIPQVITFFAIFDGLSEDYQFSKSQNKDFVRNLLKDTNNRFDKIAYFGARRAANLML